MRRFGKWLARGSGPPPGTRPARVQDAFFRMGEARRGGGADARNAALQELVEAACPGLPEVAAAVDAIDKSLGDEGLDSYQRAVHALTVAVYALRDRKHREEQEALGRLWLEDVEQIPASEKAVAARKLRATWADRAQLGLGRLVNAGEREDWPRVSLCLDKLGMICARAPFRELGAHVRAHAESLRTGDTEAGVTSLMAMGTWLSAAEAEGLLTTPLAYDPPRHRRTAVEQ